MSQIPSQETQGPAYSKFPSSGNFEYLMPGDHWEDDENSTAWRMYLESDEHKQYVKDLAEKLNKNKQAQSTRNNGNDLVAKNSNLASDSTIVQEQVSDHPKHYSYKHPEYFMPGESTPEDDALYEQLSKRFQSAEHQKYVNDLADQLEKKNQKEPNAQKPTQPST